MDEVKQGQLTGSGYACPRCRKTLDGYTATERGSQAPNPGDLSVCAYCGLVLEFVENGLVLITPATWAALGEATKQQLLKAAIAIQTVFGEREPKP